MATHGLSLNRSAGLALAKRAKKLALALEAHFHPEAAPSVLIDEGLVLLDADCTRLGHRGSDAAKGVSCRDKSKSDV